MGISPVTLRNYLKFHKDGIFANTRSIFELGSQEVTCAGFEDILAEVLELFKAPKLSSEALAQLANRGAGRDLYTLMGLEYNSIDTDGKFDALPIDLNFDDVPEPHRNKYDFVTNFGTSEHVANQLNCFKVVHDLTKLGGYMFHEVPFTGCVNHGLFTYTPKFFWMLCKSNFYEYTHMYLHCDAPREFLHPHIIPMASFCFTEETFSHQDSLVCCLMKKVVDIPFVPPLDGDLGAAPREVLKRYWTLTEKNAYKKAIKAQKKAGKKY